MSFFTRSDETVFGGTPNNFLALTDEQFLKKANLFFFNPKTNFSPIGRLPNFGHSKQLKSHSKRPF
jgi:hypothetical protein